MVLDDPPGRDLIKVLDFGIAKTPDSEITETGMVVGTPRYMSPQLLGGGEVGPDADLYALGVMLIELTSGITPFRTHNITELISQKMVSPIIPANVPKPLWPILTKVLDPDPRRRIASAAALRRQLVALDHTVDPEVERAAASGETRVLAAPTGTVGAVAIASPAMPPKGAGLIEPASRSRRTIAYGAVLLVAATAIAVVAPRSRDPRAVTPLVDASTARIAAPVDAASEVAVIDGAIAVDAAVAIRHADKPPADHASRHRPAPVLHDGGTATTVPTSNPPPAPPLPSPVDRCKQKPRPADCAPF